MSCNCFLWLWLKIYYNIIGSWKMMQEQIWDRHKVPRDLLRGNKSLNVVLTGGNRGIGYEAAKKFIDLGYHVIIGCRKPLECQEDFLNLKASGQISENGSFECLKLDLLSLDSVRNFASEILSKDIPIHILVNNAGIMFGARKVTQDGVESQLCTNYFGHFLLTSLLYPKLLEAGTATRKARIVNITSCAHYFGSWFDMDDWECKRFYSAEGSYGNSKVAQLMFTRTLARLLEYKFGKNCNVMINCCHPGVVRTGLYEQSPMTVLFFGFFFKNAKQGGDAILHCALSSKIEGKSGLYFENTHAKTPSSFSRKLSNQTTLWNNSLEKLNLSKFGNAPYLSKIM